MGFRLYNSRTLRLQIDDIAATLRLVVHLSVFFCRYLHYIVDDLEHRSLSV